MTKKVFIIVWMLLSFFHLSAHTLVMRVDEEIVQYNKYYESFIPQDVSKIDETQPMGVFINPSKFPDFLLSFYSTPQTAIFINNVLVYQHPINKVAGREVLDLKNHLSISEMNSNKPILLLFSNIKKQYLNDSLFYATDVTTNPSNLPLVTKEEPLRTIIFNNSAWIIVLLLLIFIIYIYKWYIINTSKIFESNNYNSKSLSLESIPFFKSMFLILLISMIWALSFFWPLILGEKLGVEYFVFSYIKNNPNLYLFSTIIFFAIFLKLFFYKIVDFFNGASNFNVSADKIWLYTMFRISVVIFFVELLIYFVFPFTMQLFLYQGLPWLCFGALIWLSVLTVYYNFNHSTAKNIYLFSYICTAEILPLVIFYKLLIGGI